MKKRLLHLLLGMQFSGMASAQVSTDKKSWLPDNRASFLSSCIGSAKAFLSSDSARYYCYCMQEYTEARFPDFKEVEKITDADMQKPEWQKAIQECGGGSWTTKDREDFLANCIPSAKASGTTESKASSYCECMLYKVEKLYPDIAKATAELNEEALQSPKWKAIIQGCLDF